MLLQLAIAHVSRFLEHSVCPGDPFRVFRPRLGVAKPPTPPALAISEFGAVGRAEYLDGRVQQGEVSLRGRVDVLTIVDSVRIAAAPPSTSAPCCR